MVFEVLSKQKIRGFEAISKAIKQKSLEFIGELGSARAGMMLLHDAYEKEKQSGTMKISHNHVDEARAILSLIDKVDNQPVIVRSLGVSGIFNKTKKYVQR
ncbi:MAG: Rpp14/Pop5 family protein [Candidatus Woesearchaeota archaeon]|nr:Rpp14/Pop5 family protein [Candidatus Woesearchaeota archaeon]MDP7458158.1 Rpp14/Pop5 family protein [Candidatus Woesearchaeota archaeon]